MISKSKTTLIHPATGETLSGYTVWIAGSARADECKVLRVGRKWLLCDRDKENGSLVGKTYGLFPSLKSAYTDAFSL